MMVVQIKNDLTHGPQYSVGSKCQDTNDSLALAYAFVLAHLHRIAELTT